MHLRDYQLQAISDVRASMHKHRRVCLVVPTGGGKTAIGAHVADRAREKGKRVLWLAHRRELVSQAAKRIEGSGIVMAGVQPAAASIQVASVDTLTARGELPPADLIVVDECHHATAETWRDIIQAYPLAYVLGLTATPERSDGVALGHIFQDLVAGPSVQDLIALGFLVDCDVIAPDSEKNALACEPIEAWQKWCRKGDAGFIFCRTIEQSKKLAAEFNAHGIPARHVDGETNHIHRSDAISSFEAGFVNVLTSVFVFTEGVDLPRARVCLLARGCGATGTYLQMVGRVLRPYPLKERALLIDLVGAVHSHGLPTDDRKYSLEGSAISGGDDIQPLTQCDECGAVFRSPPSKISHRKLEINETVRAGDIIRSQRELKADDGGLMWPTGGDRAVVLSEIGKNAFEVSRGGDITREETIRSCPRCEHQLPNPEEPDVVDRKMSGVREALRPHATKEERVRKYREWQELGRARGYKPSWAAIKYKAVYGAWPRGL